MNERRMDAASIQSAIASRLPQRARWLIGNITLDFSRYSEPRSLAAEFVEWGLSDADVADIEHRSDLIVFGIWNSYEGGGARPALAVRQSDGKVFYVDVEAYEELSLLNSSLEAFIDTFCLLDKYLGHGQPIHFIREPMQRIRRVDVQLSERRHSTDLWGKPPEVAAIKAYFHHMR